MLPKREFLFPEWDELVSTFQREGSSTWSKCAEAIQKVCCNFSLASEKSEPKWETSYAACQVVSSSAAGTVQLQADLNLWFSCKMLFVVFLYVNWLYSLLLLCYQLLILNGRLMEKWICNRFAYNLWTLFIPNRLVELGNPLLSGNEVNSC